MWKNVSQLHTKNIEFRNKQIFAAALTIVLVEWFRVHLVSGRNRLKAHQTKFFLLFLPYFIISLKNGTNKSSSTFQPIFWLIPNIPKNQMSGLLLLSNYVVKPLYA